MRFTVEAWDPEYGAPSEADLIDSSEDVDAGVEVPVAQWRPLLPECEPAPDILFVDGVRRVDANLWIDRPGQFPGFGLAATFAAGAVRCNGAATVVAAEVRRGVFTGSEADAVDTKVGRYEVMSTKGSTLEELWLGIQERMGDLEGEIAARHADTALMVVDGPLSHRRHVERAVGYVKTVEAVRRAATAEAAKQSQKTLQDAEASLSLLRDALEAYARVARNRTDLGALAVVNEYGYRSLKTKIAELKQAGSIH